MVAPAELHLGPGFEVLEPLAVPGDRGQQARQVVLRRSLLGHLDRVGPDCTVVLFLQADVRVAAPPPELVLDDGKRGLAVEPGLRVQELTGQVLVVSAVRPQHESGRLQRLGVLRALLRDPGEVRVRAQFIAHAVEVGGRPADVAHYRAFPLPFQCAVVFGRRLWPAVHVPRGVAAPGADHPHLVLNDEPDLVRRVHILGSRYVGLATDVVVSVLAERRELLAPALAAGIRTARLGVDRKVPAATHVVRFVVNENVLALGGELEEPDALRDRVEDFLPSHQRRVHSIQVGLVGTPQGRIGDWDAEPRLSRLLQGVLRRGHHGASERLHGNPKPQWLSGLPASLDPSLDTQASGVHVRVDPEPFQVLIPGRGQFHAPVEAGPVALPVQ